MQYSSFYLHPAQQEVYTDQLLNPDSPQYNIGGYLKLKGNLDKDKFHEAVRSAALVFEAFRMRFDLDAADFLCYLDEEFTTSEIVDIDFSSFSCPEAEATQWMQQRFNTPLSLQKQSIPFEQFLLKIHEDEYWFFGKYHHLITDGYGFIVFVQYLADKYQSLINNNDLSFSFPSYKQEAIKAAEYKESVDYKEAGKYWHEKLNTPPAKLLSKKYPRDNSGKKSRTYVHLLTPRQTKLLQEIQSVSKLGLLQLTTAALLIYFGKTSGQTEFVFGIPVHKRRKLFRNIVGMFSGILPFKANYHQDAKLSDVLKSIAHLQKEDYRHQHYLLGDIIRDLQVNPSKDELFEIILNYEPFNFYLDFGAGIQSSIYQLTSEYGRNPLEFCWQNYGDQQPLQLLINYQNEYFIREEIELLAQRIIYILEQFPLLLHGKVADFNILPDSELHLLHQFGTSQVNYPRDKTIVSLFEEQVKYSPHNTAVVFEQQLMTYQQLNERSNQLGRYLQKRGVREETLVPVCVERSAEMIIAILAILKAGGAYVPIDPEYPEDRIKFLLQDTGATIIISSKEIDLKKVAEGIDIINVESVDVINEAKENLQVNVKPESLAYVIYTSGSTGKPKGVMIEHRALVDHCFGVIESAHLRTCTSFALFSPLVFDAGHSIIHSAFVLGASLHVLSSQLLTDGEKVIEYLDNNVIDCIKIVPSLWLSYADGSKMALARKVMLFGGEAFPHTILDRLMQVNYNGEIYNHYGPTETTIGKCIHKINLKKHYNIVPIGKPFSNTQLYIIDHHFNLVPIGVTGDLHIGGEGIARGYLNRPELTAEKFISHPFNNKEARVYKTGDLCRWLPDGDIEYLGRIDDQVKIRGYRIELGEIESVLLQSGLLKQAVVLAKEDTNTTKRLVGYVVPEGVFNRDAITTYAKSMLPEYMVPAQWIELDSIPMTVNGKIDKKALPEPDFIELKRDNFEAPRNQLEETLTVIWKELLGVERISINDNFFDLGGHSLKAIQLTSRLHKLLNIKTDIAKVISNPTIKQLGQVLLFEKQNQFLQIKPLPEEEHYALSHAQKRIWVLSQFKDGSLAYTGSGTYIIEGSLDIRAFKEAFDAVIERHESLRTIFIEVNNEPRQKILSPSELEFRIEELDLRKNPDREVILNQRLEKDKSLVFDLTKGPLLRAILYRVEDEKYIFSFNIHHIISDGWSKGILIKDFFQAYKNLINGPDRNYVPLTIQYKDYAAWHQALFVNQGSFWREVYQEGIPTLNFPLDFERPKVLSFSGAIVQHSLPEGVTLRLQKIAVEQGMTLNNLMLALYGLLVSHYSQQDEVIIGSLTSGRSHVDLENLIGVFINFLPIRISTKKDLLLAEYLNHCQQFLTQAYSNQDYPFDLMVGDCIKQRDVTRNPFFDTMVNFHNENNLHNGGQLSEGQMTGTGISIKPLPLSDKELYQSVLDFKLDVELINNSLNLKLSYNTKLFREERMRVFLTQYVELLELVINEPDRELQEYLKWEVEKPNIVINQEAQSTSTEQVFSVNICASFVIEPVQEYIEYWSKEYELHVNVAFAPYNQIFQQLLDTQSLINS
ncbi:MAG: amino acid adenylation domain-containing protein, partial [Flavisolibacter sp.]|nr:amino acid adenylation domain-containing protein [Flavisolibacter sp.]